MALPSKWVRIIAVDSAIHMCRFIHFSDRRNTNDTPRNSNFIKDFWDTAGQERFNSLHASYYFQAHVCILVRHRAQNCTYKLSKFNFYFLPSTRYLMLQENKHTST